MQKCAKSTLLHIIHPLAMVIYYCVRNHCKIYWLKQPFYYLMILWVHWAQVGSSFAPGDLGCGYSHLGPQLLCSVQACSQSHPMLPQGWLKDWCFPSVFSLSELGCSGSWAFLPLSLLHLRISPTLHVASSAELPWRRRAPKSTKVEAARPSSDLGIELPHSID